MMSDWNARRKARGRIRRARLQRRRQRITAASVLLLLCLSVFAVGAVHYGRSKTKQIEISKHNNRSFSLPPMSPVLARAEAPKPASNLPELLDIQERFPDYREGLGRGNPEDPNEDEVPSEETNESPEKKIVVLDDLRAAPPKSMFIKAVFENSEDNFRQEKPRRWLARDFTDDVADLHGRKKGKKPKKPKDPPIPEPGTGILLAFGLTSIGALRRRERTRRRAAASDPDMNEGMVS